MASGSINGTCTGGSGSAYVFFLGWSSIGNITTNSSALKISLTIYRKDGYANSAYNLDQKPTVTLKVGGATASPTITHIDTRNGKRCVFAELSTTVKHNDDGTLKLALSASFTHYGSSSLTGGSLSGTITLDTIARASTIISVANRTLGNACAVQWTPQSKSFRYKIRFTLVGLDGWEEWSGIIHPNTTTPYTYTGYTPKIENVAKYITGNPPERGMTATLYTYSNSAATTQVGSSSSKNFMVTVPDIASTKPSVSMDIEPVTTLVGDFASLYIQGNSRVKATLSGEGKYSATIASRGMTVLGKEYATPFESDLLSTSGTITVQGRVTDSRGYSSYITKNITVIPYSKPKLIPASAERSVICARCDSEGNLSRQGTYLKIKACRSYSKVVADDGQKNFCKLRYRYKTSGSSQFRAWQELLSGTNLEDDCVDVVLGGIVSSTTTSYVVEVGVIDTVGGETGSSSIVFDIPTDVVTFHLKSGGDGAAFGKYAEITKGIEIEDDWTVYYHGNPIDTGWTSLNLTSAATAATIEVGRTGRGCLYRVINGNHVYVSLNCGFTYSNAAITLSNIPDGYRPKYKVYALCPITNRGIARLSVNSDGSVGIDWVQDSTSGAATTSFTTGWIDGYIDYWI